MNQLTAHFSEYFPLWVGIFRERIGTSLNNILASGRGRIIYTAARANTIVDAGMGVRASAKNKTNLLVLNSEVVIS